MILQALKEYYDRKSADSGSGIAHRGWFRGKIDYVIIIDEEGHFVDLSCLQEIKGTKRIPYPCPLPYIGKQALKHTNSGEDANLLWDNASFVLGVGKKGDKKRDSFISTIQQLLGDLDDPAVRAVLLFLQSGRKDPTVFSPILNHPSYGEELREGRANLTFRLLGDNEQFVFNRPATRDCISGIVEPTLQTGTCMVTGDLDQPIELCHVVIKNLFGAKKEPNLVSFNKQSFNSYAKNQSANAPVSKKAAFAYTTALNHLLSRESKQRMRVGDASTVFWSQKESDMEQHFMNFFNEVEVDNPDKGTGAIESLLKSVQTGVFQEDEGKTRFYVLGLTPFDARIAVRFWMASTVSEIATHIRLYFEDIHIIQPFYEKSLRPSLNALLAATASESRSRKANLVFYRGKYYDVQPNLSGDIMRAILEGLPYPQTLLQAAIRRIRAEQEITYPRAALIKACINRATRYTNPEIKEELKMSLDETNSNIGYRLGRLFAALEYLQIKSHASNGGRKLNTTIRDRYYGAASSTPVVVFGTLMNRLAPHHVAKLPENQKIYFNKLLAQIVDNVDGKLGFPSILGLQDQGRFAIGYYHQMQEFYTKKSEKTESKGEIL